MSNRLEFLILPVRSFCRYQYYYRISPTDVPLVRIPEVTIASIPEANYRAKQAGFQPAPYDPRQIHLDLLYQLDDLEKVRIQGHPFYEVLQYGQVSLWQFVVESSFRYSLLNLAEIIHCLCDLIERYTPSCLRVQGCFGPSEKQIISQIVHKYRLLSDWGGCRFVNWEQHDQSPLPASESASRSQPELSKPEEIVRYLTSTFPMRSFPSDQKTVLLAGYARSWVKISPDREIDIFYDAFLDSLKKNRIQAVRLELPYYSYVGGHTKEYIDQVRGADRGGLPTIFFDEYSGDEIPARTAQVREHFDQLYQWYSRQPEFQQAFCLRGISLFLPMETTWKRDLTHYLPNVVSQFWIARKLVQEVRPVGMFFYYEVGSYARALMIEACRAGVPTVGIQHAPFFPEHSYYNHRNVTVGPDTQKWFTGSIIPCKTVVYGSQAKRILSEMGCYPEESVVEAGRDWRFFSRHGATPSSRDLEQRRRQWFSRYKKIALLIHSSQWEGMEKLMAEKLDPSEYSILIKLHPSMIKDGSQNLHLYFKERGFETCRIVDFLDDAVALADLIFLPIRTSAAMHCLTVGKEFYYFDPVPPPVTIPWKAFGVDMEQTDHYEPISYSPEQQQEINRFLKSMGYDETITKDQFDVVVQKLLDDLQITDRPPEHGNDGVCRRPKIAQLEADFERLKILQRIRDLCGTSQCIGKELEIGWIPQDELVSIIIPFHNMEKTIAETIESVLFQSYTNWEMILIDDGSTDRSASIAESYAQQHPDKIRVIRHEGGANAGASASRNLGFAHAGGCYIAYLDADDLWLPDKLAFEVRLLREHPDVGMVMSPVRYFYDPPQTGKTNFDQDLSTLREGRYPAPTLCVEFLKNFGVSACPSATLIRREVAEKNSWERPFRRNFTDQVFWAKVTSSTCVYVTKRIVTCYRQHDNSSWEIAHREQTFAEQAEKFWSWIARFSSRFTDNPAFQSFLLNSCNQKMPEQAKTDYVNSRRTLSLPPESTLEDGVSRVNYKAHRWLESHIKAGTSVFEFGSGGSTLYFLNKGCRVVSVEHDAQWHEKVSQKLNGRDGHTYLLRTPQPPVAGQQRYFSEYPGDENLSFELYVRSIDSYEDGLFDIVFIDGCVRMDCIRHAAAKVKPGGCLILDNAERDQYHLAGALLKGYDVLDFYGFGPYEPELWQTLIFRKPGAHSGLQKQPSREIATHYSNTKAEPMIQTHLYELYSEIYPEPLNEIHQIGTLQCLQEYQSLFRSGSRILDVGCGQGFALQQMRQMGLNPIGITLGEEDYETCRKQGLDVRQMDMTFMELFESNTFDGLFVRHTLEHSPMPVITLKEFWRVLKPDGWIILVVPSPDAVIYPNHYSLFEPPIWASLAGTACFRVESFKAVSEYRFADRTITREYPEYQFILRKTAKQPSRPLVESNLELIKKLQGSGRTSLAPSSPQGTIDFGSLRRLAPVSRVFGGDRMTETSLPMCWYYIRQYLAAHASDIRGRVLEIGNNTYTRMFGGDRVTRSDVLHAVEGNKAATIVADLTQADHIPSDTFDCVICTQTLQCIYDVRAAVRHLYRILKPGGVLLVTGSGISQISRYDMDRWGEHWRFTTDSFQQMLEEYWPKDSVEVRSYGNVLVATAYLQGLVSGDLSEEEMNYHDPDYQMILIGRAVKPVTVSKRSMDTVPHARPAQPDGAGSTEGDEVRLIADGWDSYAKEWESDKFKVLPGHRVNHLGDEWTAEDTSGGGTTYGLSRDVIDRFDEYLNQSLLNAYLPPVAGEGLEIGPGGGRLTQWLVPRTRLLHLADSSETMLSKLKKRFSNQPHLRYYHTDGMSLPPLPKESLDYIVAFDVFVHFEPRLVYWYLRQIAELLKPGGVCILHYANAMTEIGWRQFESDLKYNVKGREHFASFGTMCPQFMEKFLQSLGMEIRSADTGTIPRDAVAVFAKPLRTPLSSEPVRPEPGAQCVEPARSNGWNPPMGQTTGTPLVLLYHRVADDLVDSQLLAVSPTHFRQHLEVLKMQYRVVPLRQLLREVQQGGGRPNTVALTFDDGYLDNLTHALPLLEEYGMHATVFVTAGHVERPRGFWWDRLEHLLLGDHPLPETLELGEAGQSYAWRLDTPQRRLTAHDELAALLRGKPTDEIEAFLSELFGWAGVEEKAGGLKLPLNVSELQRLSRSPSIEIGAHAMTHTRLSILPVVRQAQEILNCKNKLESWIRKPVTIFSYPYGSRADYKAETKALVRQAGFEYGIANVQGSVAPNTDWYEVPRRLVRNWSGPVFLEWMRSENKSALEQQTLLKRTETLRTRTKILQIGSRNNDACSSFSIS